MRVISALLLLVSMACATTPKHEVIAWQPSVEQAQYMAGLSTSLGRVRVFQQSCGTSAAKLTDNLPYSAVRVWNNSTTAVYLGGSNVNTSTTGMPICTTTSCIDDDLPSDVREVWCVAGSSVTVTVIAGTM